MTARTRWIIAAAFAGAFTAGLWAQERIDLQTPVPRPSTQNCTLDYLIFDPDLQTFANSRIEAVLKCNSGELVSKVYDATTVPTGATLLSQINTSDNRTVSMVRKIYNRLVLDGVIVGSVAGTPQ